MKNRWQTLLHSFRWPTRLGVSSHKTVQWNSWFVVEFQSSVGHIVTIAFSALHHELRKDAESRLSLTELCSGASSNLEREELLEARIHDLEGKVVETAPCMQDKVVRCC